MKFVSLGLIALLVSCSTDGVVLQGKSCSENTCPTGYYCPKVQRCEQRLPSVCHRDCAKAVCRCESDEDCSSEFVCDRGVCKQAVTSCSRHVHCPSDCTDDCGVCICSGQCMSANDAGMAVVDMSVPRDLAVLEVDLSPGPDDAASQASDAGMPADADAAPPVDSGATR